MNRKALVLPAVIGLLAPVLAACGGPGSATAEPLHQGHGMVEVP